MDKNNDGNNSIKVDYSNPVVDTSYTPVDKLKTINSHAPTGVSQPSFKATPISVAIVIIFFVGVTLLVKGCFNNEPSDIEKQEQQTKKAFYMGQQFVRKYLNAPSSASFSNPYTDKIDTYYRELVDGSYSVGGYVDAKNLFGVTLHKKWDAILIYQGADEWRLKWLKIGDQEIGKQ